MSHPFGDLLHQHLHRRHGLTQARLAEGILQAPAVISNMCRGRRLAGKQARVRVVAIIGWLHTQEVLSSQDEADALLHAAGFIGLQSDIPDEAVLLTLLSSAEEFSDARPDHSANFGQPQSETVHDPSTNLPQPATPFVGRQHELGQLIERLKNPDCRLLSLVGPGGFGKTRLGIRVGELALDEPDLAPDGVFFIALDGLENPNWVVPAIADALNFIFHERDTPENQLLSYLKHKQMLLILDNAEGILESSLVVSLLKNGPDLKLLVTSRETLNVREEWFHPIAGMSLGDFGDQTAGDARTTNGDTQTEDVDAIALFNNCAARVRPDFEPEREREHVAMICRTIGGVPLAIELAAAWLKALTCQQVIRELKAGIDILTSSMNDVPERHRSLRVVLEQSWSHLSDEERRVFRQLTIFVGGCQPEAAQAVTEAQLFLLASLIDKSILQHGQDGRYRIHPLLRQMGEERLAADAGEHESVSSRHSTYYLNFLRDREETVSGPNQSQVLQALQAEMDNIRRAWRHAARHRETEHLAGALPCLVQYLWSRGRLQEGEQLMTEALGGLPDLLIQEDELSLQCMLLARSALFVAATGETAQAKTILRDIQLPLDQKTVSREQALVLFVKGMIASYEYVPEAYPALWSAYEMYRALGDERAIANSGLHLNFIVSWMMGDLAAGRKLVGDSLRIYRRLGDLHGIAEALMYRGLSLCSYGAYDDAEQDCRESLKLARDIASRLGEARAFGGLCQVAFGREQWDLALRYAWDRLAIMEEIGHKQAIDMSYGFVGRAHTYRCDYEKAVEIIDIHPAVRDWPWCEQALIAVGRYAEAMQTLPGLTVLVAEGGWRHFSVDNLTAWAMLLTSDCPLQRNGEPFAQAKRVELAYEILSLVRDYDPDRSQAISRTRAAKLLAEFSFDADAEAGRSMPVSFAHRTTQEIAQTLLTIHLEKMPDTDDIQL